MKFKVVFIPKLGMGQPWYEQKFNTIEEAEAALLSISLYTIFLQDDARLMADESNVGMVMRDDGDEWVEVDADDNLI